MKRAVLALILVLVLGSAPAVLAGPVTLAWDPNPPIEQVVAYRVYECAKGAVANCTKLAETSQTQQQIEVVFGSHCWRATAVNVVGLESDLSNEVCFDYNKPSAANAFRVIVYVPAAQASVPKQ